MGIRLLEWVLSTMSELDPRLAAWLKGAFVVALVVIVGAKAAEATGMARKAWRDPPLEPSDRRGHDAPGAQKKEPHSHGRRGK